MTLAEWTDLQNVLTGVYGPIIAWWVVLAVAGSIIVLAVAGVVFIVHQYSGRRARRL